MTTPSKIMLNGRKSVLFIEFFIGNDYICSYKYKYDEKKEKASSKKEKSDKKKESHSGKKNRINNTVLGNDIKKAVK